MLIEFIKGCTDLIRSIQISVIKHMQRQFLKYFKSCIVYIHVYKLVVFFFPAFVGTVLPPVNQQNSWKPLAGLCIVYSANISWTEEGKSKYGNLLTK